MRKRVNECYLHRLLTVVRVIESAEADSITGKIKTTGLIFSQETPKVATGIQILQNKCKKENKKTKHSQVRKRVNECSPHRLFTVA